MRRSVKRGTPAVERTRQQQTAASEHYKLDMKKRKNKERSIRLAASDSESNWRSRHQQQGPSRKREMEKKGSFHFEPSAEENRTQ